LYKNNAVFPNHGKNLKVIHHDSFASFLMKRKTCST